jgi:hypothetical protein
VRIVRPHPYAARLGVDHVRFGRTDGFFLFQDEAFSNRERSPSTNPQWHVQRRDCCRFWTANEQVIRRRRAIVLLLFIACMASEEAEWHSLYRIPSDLQK